MAHDNYKNVLFRTLTLILKALLAATSTAKDNAKLGIKQRNTPD